MFITRAKLTKFNQKVLRCAVDLQVSLECLLYVLFVDTYACVGESDKKGCGVGSTLRNSPKWLT